MASLETEFNIPTSNSKSLSKSASLALERRKRKEERKRKQEEKREKKAAKAEKRAAKAKAKMEKKGLVQDETTEIFNSNANINGTTQNININPIPAGPKKRGRKRKVDTLSNSPSSNTPKSSGSLANQSSSSKKSKLEHLGIQNELDAKKEREKQEFLSQFPSTLYAQVAVKYKEIEAEINNLDFLQNQLKMEKQRLAENDESQSRTRFRLRIPIEESIKKLEFRIQNIVSGKLMNEFQEKMKPFLIADQEKREMEQSNKQKQITLENKVDEKLQQVAAKYPLALWNKVDHKKVPNPFNPNLEPNTIVTLKEPVQQTSSYVPSKKRLKASISGTQQPSKNGADAAHRLVAPPTFEHFVLENNVSNMENNVSNMENNVSNEETEKVLKHENEPELQPQNPSFYNYDMSFMAFEDMVITDSLYWESLVIMDDTLSSYSVPTLGNKKGQRGTGACPTIDVTSVEMCSRCGSSMRTVMHESKMECVNTTCGAVVKYLDSTQSAMGYGDDLEITSFSYERSGHFNEWLNRFQGKESNQVPESVIENIKMYLWEKKIHPDIVTPQIVLSAMKALKCKDHYDFLAQIVYKLTGKPPPRMSPELEEQCKLMFAAIQAPFAKHRPPGRINFISYAYCLYKFCELLGYREFLKCFSLLKGTDKLQKQDMIWKCICQELDWQFIPSR